MKKISEVRLAPVLQTAPYDRADIVALQALAAGVADPAAQQRAIKWIVYKACNFDGISFRPGKSDETAFAEGMRFVAQQINAVLTVDHRKIEP